MKQNFSYEMECIKEHWKQIVASLTDEERARLGDMMLESGV